MPDDAYLQKDFTSTAILKEIPEDGFAVVGMFFMLREIFGCDEGAVNIRLLASSLGMDTTLIYKYIGMLEDSGFIRTVATPSGRHIELFTRSIFRREVEYTEDTCRKYLYDYLAAHNVSVQETQKLSEYSPEAIKTANFIGKNFQKFKKFYSAIKTTLDDCKTLDFLLEDADLKTSNMIISLCGHLKMLGYLSSYAYGRSPRMVTIKVSKTSEAHNFLSAVWLEHHVFSRISSIIASPHVLVRNLHAVLPEKEQFEFDLLLCVRERIFWIESKTGKYSSFLPKYSRIARLLGLDYRNAILVSPESAEDEAELAGQYGITCCGLAELEEVIRSRLSIT